MDEPRREDRNFSEGDCFKRYEAEIRELYNVGNMKIKAVKQQMEAKPYWPRPFRQVNTVFPRFTIKTWQEKLGVLKIRKVVAKETWQDIWYHVQPFLEDPNRVRGDLRLKRTKGNVQVLVTAYGRRYEWNQVWKNMKSADAVGRQRQARQSAAANPGALLQPTPRALPKQQNMRLVRSEPFPRPTMKERLELIPLLSQDPAMAMNIRSLPMMCFIEAFSGLTITPASRDMTMPVALTSGKQFEGMPSSQLIADANNIASSMNEPSLNLTLFDLILKYQSATAQSPTNRAISPKTEFEAYMFFSMAVYQLSNNFIDVHSGRVTDLFTSLEAALQLLPKHVRQALVNSPLVSIRGAQGKLLMIAGKGRQNRLFSTLIEAGLDDGWLDIPGCGQDYLWFAASMGLENVTRRLLAKGCRVNAIPRLISHQNCTIVEAIINGNIAIARLLVVHCNVNRPISDYRNDISNDKFEKTTFQNLVQYHKDLDEAHKEFWVVGMDLLLEAGGNLDHDFKWPALQHTTLRFQESAKTTGYLDRILDHIDWSEFHATPLWPSILDYLFYFERAIFDRCFAHSRAFVSGITRAGVLLAMETDNMDNYLASKGSNRNEDIVQVLLRAIAAEQFLLSSYRPRRWLRTPTNLNLVHKLSKLTNGVGILQCMGFCKDRDAEPKMQCTHLVTFLLDAVITRCTLGELESEIPAVQFLLGMGAAVTGDQLERFTRAEERGLLDLLISHARAPDLARIGALALAEAARQNKADEVEILWSNGVDINAEVTEGTEKISILAYFASCRIVDEGVREADYNMSSATMLELCASASRNSPLENEQIRRNLFWYVYGKGHARDRLRNGSPLAAWLVLGVGTGIFPQLLRGADKDRQSRRFFIRPGLRYPQGQMNPLQEAAMTCNKEAVLALLQKDVDVNAPPGVSGKTAFQMICSFKATTREQQNQEAEIIDILLVHGAKVNAPPASVDGATALQDAAGAGDLALVILLLRRGADVNAPPAAPSNSWILPIHVTDEDYAVIYRRQTALDCAAQNGRLDTVKLLLDAKALSHIRGTTGYDGAIRAARGKGHHVVATIIREHAAKVATDQDYIDRFLSHPPRDWREYNYPDADMYGIPAMEWDSDDSDWDGDEK
ncbi:hypothetical protein N0V82_009460 [Gnomoniopsis sp. IMI 355080]|nr:hypothetical protein N0V82_009460 [Gnomoniopsis sp. IMI 355080]